MGTNIFLIPKRIVYLKYSNTFRSKLCKKLEFLFIFFDKFHQQLDNIDKTYIK